MDSRLALPGRYSDKWLCGLSFESHYRYVRLYDYYKDVLWREAEVCGPERRDQLIRELRWFWWVNEMLVLYGERMALCYMEWCLRSGICVTPLTFVFFYQLKTISPKGYFVHIGKDRCVYCGLGKLGLRAKLKNGLVYCGCGKVLGRPVRLEITCLGLGSLSRDYLSAVRRVARLSFVGEPVDFRVLFGGEISDRDYDLVVGVDSDCLFGGPFGGEEIRKELFGR